MNFSPRTKLQLLGILPLIFFIAQFVHYWRINELGHLLWMCNVGNLLLAMGLFLEKPLVIRFSAIWMIPGLLVWILYVVLAWGVFFTSTLAHVGGLAVAMVVSATCLLPGQADAKSTVTLGYVTGDVWAAAPGPREWRVLRILVPRRARVGSRRRKESSWPV